MIGERNIIRSLDIELCNNFLARYPINIYSKHNISLHTIMVKIESFCTLGTRCFLFHIVSNT